MVLHVEKALGHLETEFLYNFIPRMRGKQLYLLSQVYISTLWMTGLRRRLRLSRYRCQEDSRTLVYVKDLRQRMSV
jgi:hypothetical protein